MRRVLLLALVLGAAIMGMTAIGFAASDEAIDDDTGDTYNAPAGHADDVDFTSATYGKGPHGTRQHDVSVAGTMSKSRLPLLLLDDPNHAGVTQDCDYFVGRNQGKVALYECGTQDRLGKAKIKRVNSHTLRYTFNPKSIGNPETYGFAFILRGPADGTQVDYDRVPNFDATWEYYDAD
jgi:hypothetical protein